MPVGRFPCVAAFAAFSDYHHLELWSLFLTLGLAFTLPDGPRLELRHSMDIWYCGTRITLAHIRYVQNHNRLSASTTESLVAASPFSLLGSARSCGGSIRQAGTFA